MNIRHEKWDYKVVPFTAILHQQKQTEKVIAEQLQNLIERYSVEGWKYVGLEGVSTYVQPDQGCFGIGAKPAYMTTYQMVVFIKQANYENIPLVGN